MGKIFISQTSDRGLVSSVYKKMKREKESNNSKAELKFKSRINRTKSTEKKSRLLNMFNKMHLA